MRGLWNALLRSFPQAAREKYEDFVIQIGPPEPADPSDYTVTVLKSPAGGGTGTFKIPSIQDPGNQEDTGERLFNALFADTVGRLYAESIGMASRTACLGVRIKIRIDPEDPRLAPIANLPWETLFDPETHRFLSLNEKRPITRDLLVYGARATFRLPPRIRVLVVIANPEGLEPLDVAAERHKIDEALGPIPGFEVVFLEKASAAALRKKLQQDEKGFHILHFLGHGGVIEATGEGRIAFEREDGKPDLVSGQRLVELMGNFKSLQLIFLNSCDTGNLAGIGHRNPFAGTAAALVLAGFPAVLAMQSRISDPAAIAFSSAFYEALAEGRGLEAAVVEGRLVMGVRERWVPALYLRTDEHPGYKPNLLRRALLSLSILSISLLLLHQLRRPSEAIVTIDSPAERAQVGLHPEVSGVARGPSGYHYYLFVRQQGGNCWLQTPEGLLPNQDHKWHVTATIGGDPGQWFDLIAVASPHALDPGKADEYPCGDIADGFERAVRHVQVGGGP